MPLVRFEVRNAYGLGDPELYKGAAKREDPKALLDGVAVAGLVGILRQLGDLAEFAAEIFHDLHEQVTATAARGRRMMARIHHIEEALPTIEKAVQNQKSHIHFAYVAGSEWHSNVQIEHDHLRHTDLPRFIMDSYEECRDPPRLYLLDKFDSAGPGSGACLRRYSDPTYFKRVCASLEPVKAEKVPKVRKIRKSKKKLSRLKDVDIQHVISLSHHGSSMQCTSPGTDGQSIAAETLSASDMRLKSELGSRSTSFDSRTRLSFMDPALDRNSSIETENQDYNVSSASILKDSDIHACATATAANGDVENLEADDDFYNNYLEMESGLGMPSAAWDEKIEIVKPMPKSRFLVEPVLDVSCPLASEQPECSEVSAQLNDSHSYLGGAGKPDESNVEGPDEVDDDNGSRQDSLLEQHTPSSSSVTWDEKAEIIRTTGTQVPGSDLVATQDSDSHSFIPEACNQDTETSMPGEIDKGDVLYSVTNMQAEFPVDSPIDEVISETENYVDALNTLESETETDTEFQTKRELMPPPKPCYQGMEFTTDNMQNVGAPSCESSDSESSIMSNTSLDKDEPLQSSTMIFSGSSASVQANDNGHSGCSIDNGYEKLNDDASRLSTVEDAAADLSCNSKVPSSQEVLDTGIPTTERQEVQVPKGCDGPIQFWTNGGLLGLEPSKPPDFSVANVVRENSVPNSHVNNYDTLKVGYDTSSLKSETIVLSNEIKSTSGGKESTSSRPEVIVGGTSNLVYPTEPSGSFYHNGKNDGRPTSKSQDSVPVLSKPELGKFRETHPSNILANGTGHELRKANGHCGDDSLISLNDAASSGQHGPPKIGVSSSLTNLTRRLLMNSLQRKEALTHSDTSASPGIAYTDSTNLQNISIPNFETNKLNDSTNLQNISIPNFETNKLNGSASQESLEPNALEKADFSSEGNTFSSMLHCSGQSSPPLEHMKISFHPMNGLETNKLKLEFPDSHLHENVEELMFPSFQLLPGSNIPLQGICSESDDDTFCRSYPYSPEDACSPHSDSNSELWAQDEMSESENHEIHDDSRRFSSSTASVSSSLETEGRKHIGIDQESTSENLERENGTTAFRSGTFLDLPNVDSLTLSLTHRLGECDPVSNKSLHRTLSSSGSQPPPPPLPPLQWRTTRTPIPVDDNGLSSNEIKHLDGPELPRSLALHPSAWEVLRPLHVGEIGPDKSTLSGHKDLKKAPQGGEHDEREDLLHQIRNKTFNLRRTVTSRPSLVPRSTTNVKVAAILEKANAIRQAFASSDEGGDDETWSDG